MTPAELEHALRDLPRSGIRVKDRPYRQVWRFEFGGKPYYLKFYPREHGRLKRLLRGNPALREFTNLQTLQKAGVPAPRATAHLSGYLINGVKGDAVILEGIEPSVPLDQHLNDLALRGEDAPNHRDLVRQVIDVVAKLGRAGLGHDDLHLGNFLLGDGGKLHLLDGYAVHSGGMRTRDVMLLGHSAARFATTADVLRAWRAFSSAPLPPVDSVRRRMWRKLIEQAFGDNRYFGHLRDGAGGDWDGWFFRHAKFPRRWAPASRIEPTLADWEREWPKLKAQIDADALKVLKRRRSGDVLSGEVTLAGRTIPVIVKHPRRRYWWRWVNEIGRGGRPYRAWRKAWSLVVRDVPTAWPLLLMQRRPRFTAGAGYALDGIIVFERSAGTLLSDLRLDDLSAAARVNLFRRLGRALRSLERQGLMQYDAKTSNWMILDDERLGPVPVIIDVDGIHGTWWRRRLWAIDRLLRSLRDHPQYTPADSRELCLGYAPHAHLAREEDVVEEAVSPTGGA